jgi:hypothetical protein
MRSCTMYVNYSLKKKKLQLNFLDGERGAGPAVQKFAVAGDGGVGEDGGGCPDDKSGEESVCD